MTKLIEDAVTKSVHKAFFDAGLTLAEEEHVMEARRDFAFLRSLRQSTDGVASKIGMAVIMAMLSGVLLATWTGFKALAGK